MNNRDITGENKAATEERNEAGQFVKGKSGNPGGRPKKTAAEAKAVEMLKELTPEAVEVVVGILRNEKASFYAKLQAAEIIFNRAMGRPETYLKVDNTEMSVEEAAARLQVLFGSGEDDSASDEEASDDPDGISQSQQNKSAPDDVPSIPAVDQEVNDHAAS